MFEDLGLALRAEHVVVHVVQQSGHLARVGEALHAVGPFVADGEVVVDVCPTCAFGADLASAQAEAAGRRLVAISHRALSRLWMCCSTMWSPESQVK